MRPAPTWIALPSAVFAVALAGASIGSAPASACQALGRYTVEVLVDLRPLQSYAANGRNYVEAVKGREYAVRLRNPTGERIAVALAVDGQNVIDAKHTSAREARKWILGPYETITLSGWQTSSQTARRFVFTDEGGSYGTWLGRSADLGTITAAFFRERRAMAQLPVRSDAPMERGGAAPESKAKDDLAATGIGRPIDHPVVEVPFDEEDAPAAVTSLRYEYHEALVKLGVLPRSDDEDAALRRRERGRGFSEDGFAPDPYRGR